METRMIVSIIERRRARRLAVPSEHRIVSARVRLGNDVLVINLSAGGALVESGRRLLPGALVDLHLQSIGRAAEIVRAEILRCSVAHLDEDAMRYRGALAFERRLWWLTRDSGTGYGLLRPEPDPAAAGQRLPTVARR